MVRQSVSQPDEIMSVASPVNILLVTLVDERQDEADAIAVSCVDDLVDFDPVRRLRMFIDTEEPIITSAPL